MKIRSDVMRIYQSMHIWTGIVTSLVLFIGFYAGSLTLFKPQLDSWLTPPGQVLPQIPTAQLDQLVGQVLDQHESAKAGFSLYLQDAAASHSPIQWFATDLGRELHLDARLWQGTLDENGQLQTLQVLPSVVAELVDYLHRTAGIPGTLGHEHIGIYVLGVAAVLYFLALVSGVIVLLPSLVKTWFALRRQKGERRFWLDAHNIAGITALPFHLVICLTVIVFAFHDQIYASLAQILDDDTQISRQAPPRLTKTYELQQLLPVGRLLETAHDLAPEFKVTEMVYMGLQGPKPMVRLALFNPDRLMRGPISDYAFIHPYSGQLLNSTLSPGEAGLWGRLVASFFALHFGSYGGDWVRWAYFVLGFGGAFLFYSGNLLWLESRRKKRTKEMGIAEVPTQSRSCRVLANLTVGVCLGSMAGVAVTMVTGKLLYARVDNINHVSMAVYYSVFLGAIAWGFLLGPARAAIHLLHMCALSTLAIPMLTLLAILLPDSGLWPSTAPGTLGVDLVALVCASCFGYFAKIARKRGLEGPRDSLWSLHSGPKAPCLTSSNRVGSRQ
ncbi:PepSY domain-containing protein [Shewanella sp. AS16]|uniref:PepSY-associated TM helix domain-containing protein n=1 Tax=Shewanella sp. AS16 TaxID=2907625 RepID=UPI001F2E6811|nr:PepSY-associated TM helix domain-containing protein [Shewanella sp. AS16]MCE9687293.1 PepSY domain-containing protein [Shewanella sp. AS16]